MLTVEPNGVDGLVDTVEVGQQVVEAVPDGVQAGRANPAVVMSDEGHDVVLSRVKQQ